MLTAGGGGGAECDDFLLLIGLLFFSNLTDHLYSYIAILKSVLTFTNYIVYSEIKCCVTASEGLPINSVYIALCSLNKPLYGRSTRKHDAVFLLKSRKYNHQSTRVINVELKTETTNPS